MKLFVNDLTVIDSSVVHTDRGIVGESWIVDLMLIGDLNSESMVLDFGVVKKQIKAHIDQLVDHCLIVPTKASSVTYVKDERSTWVMGNSCRKATFFVQGPAQAFCFIDSDFIDEATLSTYLEGVILPQLPENVENISLTLRRERIEEPYYHYSHGLKKHSGNCQRIAHGHRSRIKVFKNGQIDNELQEYWAKRWEDIYLITEEDIVDAATLSVPALGLQGENFIASSYESGQGMFEILLPLERVEVMNIDSTVEEIASYIARELAEQNQGQMIEVHAFEGVGKGAIAEEFTGGGV